MAAKFARGQTVVLKVTPPQGPVQKIRMDEDGNVQYLVRYVDDAGAEQERWFDEDALQAQ